MKNKILVILIFISGGILAQLSPSTYQLGEKKLLKQNSATPMSNNINDIVFDDAKTIWLGTSRGLSSSTDNGENWTNYYNTPDFDDEGIIAVGFYEGKIWATTGHSVEINGDELPVGSGIRYSSDYGLTWNKISQPIDDSGDSSITYGINTLRALPVTTAINNISYDIAFTKNTVWISSFAAGLRKSTDLGNTWQRVVLPPDNLNSIKPTDTLNFSLQPVKGKFGPEDYLNHRVFSVIGVDDSTLYVGTANGINKSTDNGISWVKFNHKNQDSPISGNFVTALGYDIANHHIWAATWKAEDQEEYWGVSLSTNGGESWSTFLEGEKTHNFGFKYFGNSPNYSGSHVMAPTDNGIFRSTDGGNSWISPLSIKDDVTKVPIATKKFFSVNSIRRADNSTDIWIGSGNGLARLNEKFGVWEGEWKVFLASPELKSKTETYAFPNPFSPLQRSVKIKYSLESSKDVTIRIMDFGMNLVRTLIQNAPRGASSDLIEFWDGKDDNQNLVPNGVYFYRIDAGSAEPIYGKIMVVK
ncbi:MAG: hypothetical protein KJ799_15280 [Bacteroidetes bacterium]|nr:hypothetical protein [Bacteroidota bacterium]MBU2508067.1 hypothetical protein [Bacteroidota bacterium]